VVRAQEEILRGLDERSLKKQPSKVPGCRANVRQNLDPGERGITKHARKNEDAAAIDHEAVAEPSHSLSLDSSSKAATFGKRPRPYGYIRPGSKNGQRRSGTGLTMVHGHPAATVTPAAESRQGLQ
jgi:hypothetical protein